MEYIYRIASFLPSSVTNIFRHISLTNHGSHPSETWYGTSRKGPKRRLPNSGAPVIYFLFPDLVNFWTLHDTVHNFCHIFLSNNNSHPHETWYGTSNRGPTGHLPNSGPPVIYFLIRQTSGERSHRIESLCCNWWKNMHQIDA